MVLTCCCRVAIMVRSCSSLVWGGGQTLKGVPLVAVVVDETLVMVMVMAIAMFPHRRMSGLLHLYL